MESIAVFNTKGGVGKSALAVFLSDFLSTKEKKRVLIVDLDPQHFSSSALVGGARIKKHLEEKEHSLPRLMWDTKTKIDRATVQKAMVRRSKVDGKGKFLFLGEVDVLVGAAEDWRLFHDYVHKESGKAELTGNFELLSALLKPLQAEYDYCLIDFPANDRGPVTKNGIRASKWWLLPVKPLCNEIEALDLAKGVIDELSGSRSVSISPLLTILTMVHDRGSNTYRDARARLETLANASRIPALVKGAEISQGTPAINAIACTFSDSEPKTLVKKYGGGTSPLYKSMSAISNEVVSRTGKKTTKKLKKGSVLGSLFRKSRTS